MASHRPARRQRIAARLPETDTRDLMRGRVRNARIVAVTKALPAFEVRCSRAAVARLRGRFSASSCMTVAGGKTRCSVAFSVTGSEERLEGTALEAAGGEFTSRNAVGLAHIEKSAIFLAHAEPKSS